ncbi:MAG: FkbM family methyltransferase [Gaiellaceae bacterium]
MGIRKATRHVAERLLSVRIYRLEQLPWGVDFAHDVARQVQGFRFTTVFDVGANVGQSAIEFSRSFPEATTWSFEPFSEPFEELVRATHGLDVKCFKLALGSEAGQTTVAVDPHSVENSLLNAVTEGSDVHSETVEVTTVDDFTAEHGIERIEFLKVDTEGFDLEVLKGAERNLGSGAVSFVQVEAAMTRHAATLVPFDDLRGFLEARGYVLFGIYVQVPEWSGEARLRFANPVFIHGSLV